MKLLNKSLEPICKPGFVLNDHLSGTAVAVCLMPPWSAVGQTIALTAVLLRIGFTWTRKVASAAVSSYLTFPSLPPLARLGGLFLLHFP